VFCALKLDHFKQVNDQYGYAVGDGATQVRRTLQRSFHSLEFVARWGDAEFVVGMYGMTKEDGVKRLTKVLEPYFSRYLLDSITLNFR